MADTAARRDDRARAGVLTRLYTGTGAFDVVGKRKLWYAVFGVLVLVCIGSIVFRGFNLGIDFTGGTQVQFPAAGVGAPATVEDVRDVYEQSIGQEPAAVQTIGQGAAASVLIRSEPLDAAQIVTLRQALFDHFQPVGSGGQPSASAISINDVSGTWGGQITRQALIALAVFLVLVTIFLAFYFERAMAVAALVALVHDVVVTMGVYSIVGFEVTPATAIGLLTILGFSLYDTVVVYDRVRENAERYAKTGNYTYTTIMRRSLNQVLMRSINTTLVAIMPVIAMLIGSQVFGQATLQDFGIALFVGIISGVFSSLAIAAPVVVWLKEREPTFRRIRQRIIDRGGDPNDTRWVERARPTGRRAAVIQESGATATSTAVRAAQYDRPHPPRPRKKPRR